MQVAPDHVEAFRTRGVVHLPGVLDAERLATLQAAHASHIAAGGKMWSWRDHPEYLDAALIHDPHASGAVASARAGPGPWSPARTDMRISAGTERGILPAMTPT